MGTDLYLQNMKGCFVEQKKNHVQACVHIANSFFSKKLGG